MYCFISDQILFIKIANFLSHLPINIYLLYNEIKQKDINKRRNYRVLGPGRIQWFRIVPESAKINLAGLITSKLI